MAALADYNRQSSVETDGEHRIQLELLRALYAAAREEAPSPDVDEILERLVAFSEAHFMSEELLMRMHSYSDYEDHVGDHIRMMDALDGIAAAQAAGKSQLVAGQAESTLAFIAEHIATRDQHFADFLRDGK
jgi:hemerythrin